MNKEKNILFRVEIRHFRQLAKIADIFDNQILIIYIVRSAAVVLFSWRSCDISLL